MKLTEKVEANDRGTAQAAEIAEKALKERGIKGKELMRAVLAVEESAGGMTAHAEKDGKITIRIGHFSAPPRSSFYRAGKSTTRRRTLGKSEMRTSTNCPMPGRTSCGAYCCAPLPTA